MAKAKFKGKWCSRDFGNEYVNLEYEYRGHTYVVYENRTKGNEPLAWQHKNEQARIDNEIELEEKLKKSNYVGEPAQKALDRLFEYWETGEWKE